MATTKVTSGGITDATIATADIADNAVTTAKIADDAITGAKMGDSSVGTNQLVDQAVTLAKLEHGTSSNDGKFLRANNGADPTFETVTGTTINNNADNRVITGSGTANTLEGESNVHVVSDRLLIGTDTLQTLNYTTHGAIQTLGAYNTSSINITNNENSGNTSALTFNKIRGASGGVSASDNMGGINWAAYDGSAWRSGITVEGKLTGSGSNNVPSKLTFKINSGSSNTERFAITPNGVTFNGDTATANALDDYEEGTFTPTCNNSVTLYSNNDLCSYTKIGRQVTVRGQIRINDSNSNSYLVINNLPFTNVDTAEDSDMSIGAVRIWDMDVAATTIDVICLINGSSSDLGFWRNRDNGSASQLNADDGGYVAFTITYFTS